MALLNEGMNIAVSCFTVLYSSIYFVGKLEDPGELSLPGFSRFD